MATGEQPPTTGGGASGPPARTATGADRDTAARMPMWFRALSLLRGAGTQIGLLVAITGVIAAVAVDAAGGPGGLLRSLAIAGIALVVLSSILTFVPGAPRPAAAVLHPPVTGRWRCLNSPTTGIPSHGTHAFGQTFAVDIVLDPEDGSRPRFGAGPAFPRPEAYPAFGAPVLAPADGRVVRVHDARPDHRARASWGAYGYMMLEAMGRELGGDRFMVGNHVVIDAPGVGFVVLAHLRRGSIRVAPGDAVAAGQRVAECGNSGNSSEPHVHLQVCDSPRLRTSSGLPFVLTGTTDDEGAPLTQLPANDHVFRAEARPGR